MGDEVTSSVILDAGSGYVKAGLSDQEMPSTTFPAIVGRMKIDVGVGEKDQLVGNEALAKKGVLNITKPTAKGYVQDWDALEHLWQHTFQNELKIETSSHPLLFTAYPQESKAHKERLALLCFEAFYFPGVYCAVHGLLALYASGRTSGLVIDSGEDVTNVEPIQDGYFMDHAQGTVEVGGSDINEYLQSQLKGKKVVLDLEDARKLKHEKAYIPSDYAKEHENHKIGLVKSESYELPDRTTIDLGEELINCTEILFRPGMIGKFDPGVHEIIPECLQNIEVEAKKDMFSNIVLCGGNTLLRGFSNRLNRELVTLSPNSTTVKLNMLPHRESLAWMGGSVVSALKTFQTMWITQGEYQENGPSIVHRKCL